MPQARPYLLPLCQTISVSSWATNHGFHFSTTKFFPILFSRRRVKPQPPLFSYGTLLQYCSPGRFLEVILDSKQSWRDHIFPGKENLIAASKSYKHCLTYLGAQTAKLSSIFILHWSPPIDYGCHIYSSASSPILAHCDTVHHCGLHFALGAFHSSPVESLYTETDILSLF